MVKSHDSKSCPTAFHSTSLLAPACIHKKNQQYVKRKWEEIKKREREGSAISWIIEIREQRKRFTKLNKHVKFFLQFPLAFLLLHSMNTTRREWSNCFGMPRKILLPLLSSHHCCWLYIKIYSMGNKI